VGIWNRAFSAAEVAALYNNGAGTSYPFIGVRTTRNIVPRSNNEGKLGTPTLRWAEGHFQSALTLDGSPVVTEETLAPVATSGSYDDLLNRPDLTNLPNQPVNSTSSPNFQELILGGSLNFNAGGSEGTGTLRATLQLPQSYVELLTSFERAGAIIRDGQNLYLGNADGSAWRLILIAETDGKLAVSRLPTHKSTHASGGADALTPEDIGAASRSQAVAFAIAL